MEAALLVIFSGLYLATCIAPHFVARSCYHHGGKQLRVASVVLQWVCAAWLTLFYFAGRSGGEDWYGWEEKTTLVCQFLAIPVLVAMVHLFIRYHQRFHLSRSKQAPLDPQGK